MWEKIKILLIKIKNVLVGTNQNVDMITNIYQAREAYEKTPFFSGRKIRKIVAVIWDNFSSIEINTITTADQARKCYRNSRPGSKVRETIAIKWDELSFVEINAAKTVDQARRANRDSRPGGSKAEKASIIKWDELSLKQVLNVNTIDEIRSTITFSRPGSKAEKIGKDKEEKILFELILKTSNVAKVQEIRRNYLSSSNEKIKEAIDKKIEELSKK